MSKYIIELDDRIKLVTSVGVTENGVVYTTSDYVHNLEELNSDYINENYGSMQDEAYRRGLEDAWEAARKIIRMPDGDILDLFPDCYASVCTAVQAILKYDASEAIAKLKAYEDKHSGRIEVGDEVVTRGLIPGNTFFVTKVTESSVYGISNDGSWNFYNKESVTKTGKHYDIASILEAMRT